MDRVGGEDTGNSVDITLAIMGLVVSGTGWMDDELDFSFGVSASFTGS